MSPDLDDLAWPVAIGDCALLIAFSLAVLIGCGTVAAYTLANIWAIGG